MLIGFLQINILRSLGELNIQKKCFMFTIRVEYIFIGCLIAFIIVYYLKRDIEQEIYDEDED